MSAFNLSIWRVGELGEEEGELNTFVSYVCARAHITLNRFYHPEENIFFLSCL